MRDSSRESLLLLATLFITHEKYAKALTLLAALYEVDPTEERVLRSLCYTLIMQKHYERALVVMEELMHVGSATMSTSDKISALRLKAATLWGLGQGEEARICLDQSMALLETTREQPLPAEQKNFFR